MTLLGSGCRAKSEVNLLKAIIDFERVGPSLTLAREKSSANFSAPGNLMMVNVDRFGNGFSFVIWKCREMYFSKSIQRSTKNKFDQMILIISVQVKSIKIFNRSLLDESN